MLTDRQIKSLENDRPQVEVFDGTVPGFGIRVSNKDRKNFFLVYLSRRSADPRRRLLAKPVSGQPQSLVKEET
jgi:hypothetical protein